MKLLPPRLLSGKERGYSIDALLSQARDETLDTEAPTGFRKLMGFNLPHWQRPNVWTKEQNVRFIESLFLGLGAGSYVATDIEYDESNSSMMLPTSLLLIDGQQRITAIQDFVNNIFPVFGDIHYDDMSLAEKRLRFKHVAFPCVEISASNDERVLKELYYRLNFSGTAHTADDLARLEIQP